MTIKETCTEYACYYHKGFESEDVVKCGKRVTEIKNNKCVDFVQRTLVQQNINRRKSKDEKR